jgi:hypothetical protein
MVSGDRPYTVWLSQRSHRTQVGGGAVPPALRRLLATPRCTGSARQQLTLFGVLTDRSRNSRSSADVLEMMVDGAGPGAARYVGALLDVLVVSSTTSDTRIVRAPRHQVRVRVHCSTGGFVADRLTGLVRYGSANATTGSTAPTCPRWPPAPTWCLR